MEIQRKKKVKAETVAEAMGNTVMKIVSDTITDLEAQKNKISKKIGIAPANFPLFLGVKKGVKYLVEFQNLVLI